MSTDANMSTHEHRCEMFLCGNYGLPATLSSRVACFFSCRRLSAGLLGRALYPEGPAGAGDRPMGGSKGNKCVKILNSEHSCRPEEYVCDTICATGVPADNSRRSGAAAWWLPQWPGDGHCCGRDRAASVDLLREHWSPRCPPGVCRTIRTRYLEHAYSHRTVVGYI